MINLARWQFLSVDQLATQLPEQLAAVVARRLELPEELASAAEELLARFKDGTPAAAAIASSESLRRGELYRLALILERLGCNSLQRDVVGEGEIGLGLLNCAHELFRLSSGEGRPTRQMRSVLLAVCRATIDAETAVIEEGQSDASQLLLALDDFITAAWGELPSQLEVQLHELLFEAFERLRNEHDDDVAFQERFVRDNIEGILALELPVRLEPVRERWVELGQHYAPAAVRLAQRSVRRPSDLGDLLDAALWTRLDDAMSAGDPRSLRAALEGAEEILEENLRLRLDADAEYAAPTSEIRSRRESDPFFLKARDLLRANDPSSIDEFRSIVFKRPDTTFAKEWFAYSLLRLGRDNDKWDAVRELALALESPRFDAERSWSVRWNLACALKRIPARSSEALDVLLPLLSNEIHPGKAFDLCLLWAIDQNRDDVLDRLLLQCRHSEAHLLAALRESRELELATSPSVSTDHFRRLNRIARDPDRLIPSPSEYFENPRHLDAVLQLFFESALIDAGIEWFRQRFFEGGERRSYKNWECLSKLHEERGDFSASWRCRVEQWQLTARNRKLSSERKRTQIASLLNFALERGFSDAGLELLRRTWRDAGLTAAQEEIWEQRLLPSNTGRPPTPTSPAVTEDPQAAIDSLAGSFRDIRSIDHLVGRHDGITTLLDAVEQKSPGRDAEAITAIRRALALADVARTADSEAAQKLEAELRAQLQPLADDSRLPYEMQSLALACRRAIENFSSTLHALPDLVITTPGDLRVTIDPVLSGGYSTHVGARLENRSSEDLRDLRVSFLSSVPSVAVSQDEVVIERLLAGETTIVDVAVDVRAPVDNEPHMRVHVSYEIGGLQRTSHANGALPVMSVATDVPVTLRYVTNSPVSADRTDLFHGRSRELGDLREAFADGVLRRLYFVNGIRRVGKSTLLTHLVRTVQPDIVGVTVNFETILEGQEFTSQQLVRQLVRDALDQLRDLSPATSLDIEVPGPDEFALDPAWVVFDTSLRRIADCFGKPVLVCFDEIQHAIKRISSPDDPLDEGLLSWLRSKIQRPTNLLFICTGSESYATIRRRHDHHIWGNITPYNVSFVDRNALSEIATKPVETDGVAWLPEAIERLWDMTEGHPWVTQIISEVAVSALNRERRRVVLPGDIDRAVESASADDNINELWWNEQDGVVTATHRQIAFVILQRQTERRGGVPEAELAEACHRAGVRNLGSYIQEMKELELIAEFGPHDDLRWRIRGGFLERYLSILKGRIERESGPHPVNDAGAPLAVLLDVENIKISLNELLEKMPIAEVGELRRRLDGDELARLLLTAATRHGAPRQRWAVGNWDKGMLQGDQRSFKSAGFQPDIAGSDKADASDHVLRERLHAILREQPDIGTYVIGTGDGDYREAIATLQQQGKHVVLWATRKNVSTSYGGLSLTGPDQIEIEWLEDIVFGASDAKVE